MNKHEQMKKAATLEDLRKELTPEELERVRQMREFDTIKPNTPTWSVAVFNDQLRAQRRVKMSTVEHRVNNVLKVKNAMLRLKSQLLLGEITEKHENGSNLTAEEVQWLLNDYEWKLIGEVRAIPFELGELRSVVGHLTIDRKIAMTQEEFDEYVVSVEQRLKGMGYDLFA